MRDTIFCQIPGPTTTGSSTTTSIEASIREVAAYVQSYVPGYRLTVDPQFSVTPDGTHRVAIFVEVEGAGDFFPPYAGNLDIMTAAATQVGNQIAQHLDVESEPPDMPYSDELDIRMTDSALRDGSHAKGHQFTERARALESSAPSTPPACR